MLLLLAVILFGLGSSLYDAQMIHGAEYLARSQNSIAEIQTVEAARGTSWTGTAGVLVSNRVTYQVARTPRRHGEKAAQRHPPQP